MTTGRQGDEYHSPCVLILFDVSMIHGCDRECQYLELHNNSPQKHLTPLVVSATLELSPLMVSDRVRKKAKAVSETIYPQTPGRYHVWQTVGGWVVVFIEDRHHMRNVDGGRVYPYRQGAYRRCKKLNDALPQEKKFTYEDIDIEQLTATDLREEAQESRDAQAYRITIIGHAEKADALYDPSSRRLGIAWGADATWADVDDVESGINMWLNDGEEWSRRN